jgi:3-methyladenine DNA glycosylase AlkD
MRMLQGSGRKMAKTGMAVSARLPLHNLVSARLGGWRCASTRDRTMPNVASIMAELKKKGKENTRKIYARHGMAADRLYGVSVADLKLMAKKIRGEQALAYELYATGIMEAMYLAGMVADGLKMTPKQLNVWALGAVDMQMIAEYTVPWVTVDNPQGRELALQWIKSKNEHVASSGWSTYSGLVALKDDQELDLAEIERLLGHIVKEIHRAQNRVRQTMNGFVIAVGSYVQPLLTTAKAAARQIGEVSVDMGDTACKVPLALAYIEKNEAAGRIGKKRKTIRC